MKKLNIYLILNKKKKRMMYNYYLKLFNSTYLIIINS